MSSGSILPRGVTPDVRVLGQGPEAKITRGIFPREIRLDPHLGKDIKTVSGHPPSRTGQGREPPRHLPDLAVRQIS